MRGKQKDKAYAKALYYYEEGEIDKALLKCNEAITKNLKNSAAINLKGLILYIQGDLQGARTQWKVNMDTNKDRLAKIYYEDSKNDEDKFATYKEAEKLIRELKIDEALRLLNKCKESDFNSIKVNLALAVCSLRKGDCRTSTSYVLKAIDIDKHNSTAKVMLKELGEFHEIKIPKSKSTYKNITLGIAILLTVSGIFVGGVSLFNKFHKNSSEKSLVAEDNLKDELDEQLEDKTVDYPKEDTTIENETSEIGETKIESLVDFDELEVNIANKEYDEIFNKLKKLNGVNLEGREKTLQYNANNLLKSEGVQYFYENGSNYYDSGQYELAKDQLTKGYLYSEGSYLRSHLIFFCASSNELTGNTEEAINLYKQYYDEFKELDYTPEVLYILVDLYKNINIDESIKYAKIIRNEYFSSIYNNDVISSLLDNN